MLSKAMARVLVSVPYNDLAHVYKDGRTVHALRTRGYLTKVEWNAGIATYTFKLTKLGIRVARQLKFVDKELLAAEILS